MDRTIEREFFKAFDYGGVVCNCIEYMEHKYGFRDTNDSWKKHYEIDLPKQILADTMAFGDSVITGRNSLLMDEIRANLAECCTATQQLQYIYSLITPFKALSDVYYPFAVIKRIDAEILKMKGADTEIWGNRIPDLEKQKSECKAKEDEFFRLTNTFEDDSEWRKEDTVESCLSAFRRISFIYAKRLYCLLLENKINLLKIQDECGVYLATDYNIYSIADYVGTIEIAQKLLDELPELEMEQNNKEFSMPEELCTPEAQAIFNKAVDCKFIEQREDGRYKWLGSNRECVYFAWRFNVEIFKKPAYVNEERRRYKDEKMEWKLFESLFHRKNLAQEYTKIKDNECDYPKVDKIFS